MTRQLVAALIAFTMPGWFVVPLPARQQSFAIVGGLAQRSDVVVHAISRDRGLRRGTAADLSSREVEGTLFDAEPQLFGRLYLPRLVEATGGSLFVAESSGLQAAFARVVNEFRSRYVLTYSPEGVAPGGWHTIDVTVNGPKADVQARRGYLR